MAADAAWADAAVWAGEGIRREVFFFDSGAARLYGSLYSGVEVARTFGFVACGSWGVEADRIEPLIRSVALCAARLGGAFLVFHYPGYGDSYGDLANADLNDLAQSAICAMDEASRRRPNCDWSLTGFMFGASIAALAQSHTDVDRLLLVQPILRPGAHLRWLSRRSEPLAPGPAPREMLPAGTAPGMAYGYPVPSRLVGGTADDAVAAALATFEGSGTVIRHTKAEQLDPVPEHFDRVEVPGSLRFGTQNHPALAAAIAEWLDRYAGEVNR